MKVKIGDLLDHYNKVDECTGVHYKVLQVFSNGNFVAEHVAVDGLSYLFNQEGRPDAVAMKHSRSTNSFSFRLKTKPEYQVAIIYSDDSYIKWEDPKTLNLGACASSTWRYLIRTKGNPESVRLVGRERLEEILDL